jgi:hypothetical protein
VETQESGRVLRRVDPPAYLPEDALDVVTLNIFGGQTLSSCKGAQRTVFLQMYGGGGLSPDQAMTGSDEVRSRGWDILRFAHGQFAQGTFNRRMHPTSTFW